MSSGKRWGGWGIAVGLWGAACSRENPTFDQDGSGGPTEGSASAGTVGDATLTSGPPGDGTIGDGTIGEGSVDGGSEGSIVCGSDEECADDKFCNGAEICDPSHPEADGSGCLPASGPPCPDGADCREDAQDCVTNCNRGGDADEDGVNAIECGGTDCDDADGLVYPDAPEICDDVDNDCNPATLGETDVDLDGAISNECCNFMDGSLECGPDCNDFNPGIIEPGGDWAHCTACNQPCDAAQACDAGTCIEARRVFVSSAVQAGDMGSLEAADDICQGLADIEGLGGAFQAYLRDADTTIETRLEHATVPYVRLDGERIANDWTDLRDGNLQAPLALDEHRELHMEMFERAWTGLVPDGSMFESDCGGWTSGFEGEGAAGEVAGMGPNWQSLMFPTLCTFELRLYCIEQDGGG